jgi:hypothetical protein
MGHLRGGRLRWSVAGALVVALVATVIAAWPLVRHAEPGHPPGSRVIGCRIQASYRLAHCRAGRGGPGYRDESPFVRVQALFVQRSFPGSTSDWIVGYMAVSQRLSAW